MTGIGGGGQVRARQHQGKACHKRRDGKMLRLGGVKKRRVLINKSCWKLSGGGGTGSGQAGGGRKGERVNRGGACVEEKQVWKVAGEGA